MVSNIWLQILFFALNIGIGVYQAHRFDHDQKRINHYAWAIYYTLAVIPVLIFTTNWWLASALFIQHLPVFNTALNFSRKPDRKPIFYTHPEDPQGSKLDKLWGKYYPIVFFISLAALVVVQWLIF